MTVALESWAASWRPQDKRPLCEWAAEHVKPPGSARSTRFDVSATPWLREPLEFSCDNRVAEQVIILPTGSGKTTIIDVKVPHAIAEDPGSILIGMQSDPDAKEYAEERLYPILDAIDPLKPILSRLNRHARRKDALMLPHMTVFIGGSNKTNFQRKSVRVFIVDEAWLVKHGLIEEGRARLHNRWNGRIIILSQGGDTHVLAGVQKVETELFGAWQRTDRRKYGMICPDCGETHPWTMRQVKYEDATLPDGTIDETAILQSASYECAGRCKTRFEDKKPIRRMLSMASVYEVTNPNHLARHHGWTAPAPAMFHESWGSLALGWKKAMMAKHQGDSEPFKIFITKRLAEFWKDDEDAPGAVLGGAGYKLSEYANGEKWDGEVYRFMTIDRQRDHFWAVVRAWKPDGASRLLYEGKVLTVEMCREIQQRFKVIDDYTFQDAQHATGDVYDDCVKYGWVALHGSDDSGFTWNLPKRRPIRKFFTPLRRAAAPLGGVARYIFWSNEKVKDILMQLRAGRGASWQTADDISAHYQLQINSESKRPHINRKTKRVSEIYQVIGSRPNHIFDCEAEQIVAALIKGVLGGHEVEVSDDKPEEKAA